MIKHIVFDWDGTLADTYSVLSAACTYAFVKLGMEPISYDEVKKITSSVQNKDFLQCIYGDRKDDARKLFYDYIEKHHITNLKAIPNAIKLLEFCKDNNIKCYIVTNKTRKYFVEECDKLGFSKYFANIVAAGDFSEDKPHPLATRAVFGYNVPDPESILMIGDGIADYKTARTYDDENKKAKCIILDPQNKYSGDEPDYKIDNLLEVIGILKTYNKV